MVPKPPPLSPPLCTLPPGPGPARFVCYCEEEGIGAKAQGGFNLYVTDAAELWSTCFTPDSLAALVACKQQAVTFTLLEDGASLTLSGGPLALDLNLSKVPGPEAASRLQALTLGLAERVCSLERWLTGGVGGGHPAASLGSPCPCLHSWLSSPAAEGTAASPRKNPRLAEPQQFLPGKDLGWGCACCSVTQFPQNKTQAPEIGSYVERGCSPGILLDSGAPPSCFPQTQILREAALDLGSEGGVRESPSSTLASRVRNQPVV
ncbi:protein PAXX isoform 3-T5 [Hipposideros larvatus]